jgi:hypothetical protein
VLSERLFLWTGDKRQMSKTLDKHLFNLKFAAKQLERNAKKCDKEEKVEKSKLKKVSFRGAKRHEIRLSRMLERFQVLYHGIW